MNPSPISRTGALSRSGVPACTNTPARPDIPSRTGAAYIRVSTDDQTELSPDAQLRMIRAAALADGFSIPEPFIFIEKRGISGRHAGNRPAFQKMIAEAKSSFPPPFSRLYLWKFSRFARNQEESIFYKGILRKKCGIEIKSISEPIMEGMFGRLIETIIEWSDEYYSINLSGEVLRGMTEKALQKGYQTSPCLGYRAAGGGRPFLLVPEEIQIVEQIFLDFHYGMTPSGIAKKLNLYGFSTKRGNPFDSRSVTRILKNPFYAGTVIWNGHQFQGAHEISPILAALYGPNQNLLEALKKTKVSPNASASSLRSKAGGSHWLCGLLSCGICASSLSFLQPKGRSSAFQCWKYAKGLHPGSCSLSAAAAEQAVQTAVSQLILWAGYENYRLLPDPSLPSAGMQRRPGGMQNRPGGMQSQPVETQSQPAETPNRPDSVARLLLQLSKKEERIRCAYENGVDTLEEYKARKEKLEAERRRLVSGSALALNRAAPLDEAALPDEAAFSSLPAVLAALPCVLKTIRVFRKENRLQFIWKIDFDFPSQTYLQSGSAMLQ